MCDTADQVRRYVLADAPAILAAISAEKAQSCALVNASFYVGKIEAKIVSEDGVWEITHIKQANATNAETVSRSVAEAARVIGPD